MNDVRRDVIGSCLNRFEFYYLFFYQIQRFGWLKFVFFLGRDNEFEEFRMCFGKGRGSEKESYCV